MPAGHRPLTPGIPTAIRFALVEIDRLRPHERVRPALLRRTMEEIQAAGCVHRPILVADGDFVILDGHHRWAALRDLGYRKVPAHLVAYRDAVVDLATWPGAIVSSVTKDEVLDRGRRGDLFPPKTTRHTVSEPLDDVRVDLADLR